METDLDTDVGLSVALSEVFSEGYECEHPGHKSTVLGTHAGPGEWYASIRCPDCNSRRVYVMCDRFKCHVQNSGMDFYCMACRLTMGASELVVTFVRIGDGL